MADEANRTPAEVMGQRLEVFRPMVGNIIAGFIISGLLVAGGLAVIIGPTLKAAGATGTCRITTNTGWRGSGSSCSG